MIRWPGKIKAGTVTNEIIHITDLLPTLAKVAGYQVPQDRMIDGIDQLDFLTGKSEKSAREGFPVFNGDDLFAYKWRNWKMHFIKMDSMYGSPQRLNVPYLYNLIEDPKERYAAQHIDPAMLWVFPVILKKVVAFQASLAKEPPIQLGTPDPYEPGKKK